MTGTTAEGTTALVAVAAALGATLAIGVAALAGMLPEAANQAWEEIVASAQEVITHE